MSRMLKIICCAIAFVCLSAKGVHHSGSPLPLHIDYPDYFGNRITIPLDNPTTEQGVYLGRMLFYEPALSAGDLISCSTCHQQERAFTDGLQFSKGFDGTPQPRNTMSLANLLWVNNFFWDGRAKGLEKQAETPLTSIHEMGQSLDASAKKLLGKKIYSRRFKEAFGAELITGERIIMALAQFERTLVSANSKYDQYLRGEYQPTVSERKGIELFYGNPDPATGIRGASCGHCHGGPKTFIELFHNNGLDSVSDDTGREKITGQAYDRGRFRVATLRNIALTSPYMHDGRFKTLEEVINHYSDHIIQSNTLSPFLQNNSNEPNGTALELNTQEKRDLFAFLQLLTDSSFIKDKRFANPFKTVL